VKTTLNGCPLPIETSIDLSEISHDQFDVNELENNYSTVYNRFPHGIDRTAVNLRISMKHNQSTNLLVEVWKKADYPAGKPVSKKNVTYYQPTYETDSDYRSVSADFYGLFENETESFVYKITDGFGQTQVEEFSVTHIRYNNDEFVENPSVTPTASWYDTLYEGNFDEYLSLDINMNPTTYWMYQCAVVIDGKSIWEYFPGLEGNMNCNNSGGYSYSQIWMAIPYVPEEWIGKKIEIYTRARHKSTRQYFNFKYEVPMEIILKDDPNWYVNMCDWRDSDRDEMPDGWEYKVGLNPNKNDSGLDRNNDGEKNIDEFIRINPDIINCYE
jgi:hypothetical protein